MSVDEEIQALRVQIGRLQEELNSSERSHTPEEYELRCEKQDAITSMRRQIAHLREEDCVVPLGIVPSFDGGYGQWNRWRVETGQFRRVFLFVSVLVSGRSTQTVVFSFEKTKVFTFGWPNMEVLEGHPLRLNGIDLFGLFEVKYSSLIRSMRETMDAHSSYGSSELDGYHHFVLKDEPGELVCIALGVDVWVSEHDYDEINATLAEAEREGRNHQ